MIGSMLSPMVNTGSTSSLLLPLPLSASLSGLLTPRSSSFSFLTQAEFNQWLNTLTTVAPITALSVGIGLTIGGSCLMALGSVIMKIAIHKESRRLERDIPIPVTSYYWWLGLSTYSLGAFLHLVGLGFAPASVLAPLNSLGLVANALGATTFLNEHLSLLDGLWTATTMVGVTLCAASAFLPHDESGVVDGIDSWSDPMYITYIVVCCMMLILCLVLVNQREAQAADEQYELAYRQHLIDGHVEMSDLTKVLAQRIRKTGDRDPTTAEHQEKLLRDLIEERRKAYEDTVTWGGGNPGFPPYIGLFYSIVSGIIGAQCVLQLKEICAFFKNSVQQPQLWFSTQPYISTLLGLTSVVLQMHFLNLGLARGDATVVIPAYYVSWTIFGTLGGFAKFHEIRGFSVLQICLFVLGLGITLVSIVLMASGEVRRVKDDVDAKLTPLAGLPESVVEMPLRFGVPLGMGLGIIPVGRLAGRLRPVHSGDHPNMRRTRSLHEFPPGWLEREADRRQSASRFSWTVAGCPPPIFCHPEPTSGDAKLDLQAQYKPVPTVEPDAYGNAVTVPIRTTPSGTQGKRAPKGGGLPGTRTRKYKTLNEICFDLDPKHAAALPDGILSSLLEQEEEQDKIYEEPVEDDNGREPQTQIQESSLVQRIDTLGDKCLFLDPPNDEHHRAGLSERTSWKDFLLKIIQRVYT